ncbi:MAG TPA: hypothetical protein VLF91_03615 [Candidatus Saccharimonadales bacterium]|nr:hypothetical protein [Candidatus Saccharimonadales bacterium]
MRQDIEEVLDAAINTRVANRFAPFGGTYKVMPADAPETIKVVVAGGQLIHTQAWALDNLLRAIDGVQAVVWHTDPYDLQEQTAWAHVGYATSVRANQVVLDAAIATITVADAAQRDAIVSVLTEVVQDILTLGTVDLVAMELPVALTNEETAMLGERLDALPMVRRALAKVRTDFPDADIRRLFGYDACTPIGVFIDTTSGPEIMADIKAAMIQFAEDVDAARSAAEIVAEQQQADALHQELFGDDPGPDLSGGDILASLRGYRLF